MFINFWYPALASDALADQPVGVQMLGQRFVLGRDESGTAFCLSDTCSHRGGALSGGNLREGCIECPYHGWRFGADGGCRRIPSLGPVARIPGRTRIDSYPVVERYGLVFVFLGDLPEGERPPILEIPAYGQPGWRANLLEFEARCNFQRSVENALDPSHTEFVHSFGNGGADPGYAFPDYEIVESDWGCGFETHFTVRMPDGSNTSSTAGTTQFGAAQFVTHIRFRDQATDQFTYEVPIDEERTRVFLVNMRNYGLDPSADDASVAANMRVINEDLQVIEDIQPVITSTNPKHEFLVPADRITARYRQLLQDWTDRGWRIDTEAASAASRRRALAIASPARRGPGPAFILDAVPVIPGK